MSNTNNNLEIFEQAIKYCQVDPELLERWLQMYGVSVKLLIPRKDSKDVELYKKSFGSVALDDTPEYYEYKTIDVLFHNLDYTKLENGFETQVLAVYPYELESTYLIEMEYLDHIYTFVVASESLMKYSDLIYRFEVRLNRVRQVDE